MFRINGSCGKLAAAAAACLFLTSALGGCTNAGETAAADGTSEGLGVADDFAEQEEMLLVAGLDYSNLQQYYNTTEVYRGDYTQLLQMDATAVYPTYANVTVRTSGIELGNDAQLVFEEYLVSEGSVVKEGDALFTFSVVTASDKISEASAQLRLQRSREEYEAYAAAQTAQQAQWYAQLSAMEEGTEKQIQMYEYTKAQLQLEDTLQAMQDNIAALEAQISEDAVYTVTAPNAGIITELNRELAAGDEIAPDTYIGGLSSATEVLFVVTDADTKLRCGQQVTLHTSGYWGYGDNAEYGADDETYSATVISAPSALSPDMQRLSGFSAYLRVDDVDSISMVSEYDMYYSWGYGKIYTMVAEVIDTSDVLLVDAAAVQMDEDKTYVYVLESGKLHKRYFTAGGTNAKVYWIIDGLEEGMTIVLP